jgi:hypothetical protein
MTREDFRREIGEALDSISGSPSPALSDRVRSALVEAPEHRGPIWIAALAAVVIAVILVGVLLVGNPLNRPVGSAGPGHTPNASPAPVPSPSPSPIPSASPDVSCGSDKITPTRTPPTGFIDAMRTGTHPGYDRLTIELKNGLPTSIELRPQTSAKFTLSPSNQPVTLAGTDGIVVILKGADAHTAYKGVRDIKANYAGLAEVRVLEDFEGQVSLGLGLNVSPCHRPFTLTSAILVNPPRVVIDIPTS